MSGKKEYTLKHRQRVSRVYTAVTYSIIAILLFFIIAPIIIGIKWEAEIDTYLLKHKYVVGPALIVASIFLLKDEIKSRKEKLNWPIEFIFWCAMLSVGVGLLFGVKIL